MLDDSAQRVTNPPDPAAPAAPVGRRRRLLWWVLGPLLGLLAVAAIGAALIRVPYVAIAPGSARSTAPSIVVPEDRSFPAQGSISFTTVSVRDLTLFQALSGWLDPAVDVVPSEDQRGGLSREESRQLNQVRMDNSKLVAKQVAFEKLGYQVPVTGTGSLISGVEPGTPAAEVLEPGDTIVGVDGQPVRVNEDLTGALVGRAPGDALALTVERAGSRTTEEISITLVERPDQPGTPLIGVGIQTRDLSYEFPFPVEIDSGEVGGPSAGLAFTLGLLDRLTPGELTGGAAVAVTGTIEPDGSIGPVGGVVQKTEAVKAAGIELFIVPSAEYDQALAHASDGLRIAKADTLDEALEILGSVGGNALALGSPGTEAAAGT
ncbi:PDZ domain-containing protein [soil metagenome]